MAEAWRDQFKKDSTGRFDGTYKGVPFRISSHSLESGRRIQNHVFPYKDLAWTEDLGRKQRKFSLELYVIGNDYFADRDALLAALESEGAGVLVHPYLGTKTVECETVSLSETSTDGGMAKFSVTFVETSRKPAPDMAIDPISEVDAATDSVNENIVKDFQGFDVSFLSDFGLQRTVDMVDAANDKIQFTADSFPGNFGVAELGYSIRVIKETTRDLIRKPFDLAASTLEAFDFLLASINVQGLNPFEEEFPDAKEKTLLSSREQRASMREAINFPLDLPEVIGTTPSKEQERENQRLYASLVKAAGITKLSQIAVRTTYATYEEAIEERDYIVSEIEAILEDPKVSDDSYSAFMDLKAAIVRGIPNEESEEARISYIYLQEAMPSLVTAYELYGNLSFEQDVILRNKIRHPAFMPAGSLEVIAGG